MRRNWQVLRGTVVLALARVMDRASTFVIALLIAHRRGATGLGTFCTAAMAFCAFAIAGQAGTTTYLVREISETEHGRPATWCT